MFWFIPLGLLELVLGLIKANSAVRQNTCIEVHSLMRDLFSIVTHGGSTEISLEISSHVESSDTQNIQNVHF